MKKGSEGGGGVLAGEGEDDDEPLQNTHPVCNSCWHASWLVVLLIITCMLVYLSQNLMLR